MRSEAGGEWKWTEEDDKILEEVDRQLRKDLWQAIMIGGISGLVVTVLVSVIHFSGLCDALKPALCRFGG